MALKSSTGKAYTLFHACLPENKNVEKQLILQEIIESKEYRQLKLYPVATGIFNKYFAPDILKHLNLDELKKVQVTIPKTKAVLELMIKYKSFGDPSKISSADKPDFTSVDSLNRFINKAESELKTSPVTNITNISDTNILSIFDDDIEKDVESIIGNTSVQELSTVETDFDKYFSGKKYWINSELLSEKRVELLNQLNTIKFEKTKLMKGNKKYLKYKLIVSWIYLTSVICSFNLPLSDIESMSFLGISGLGWILFLILG